MPKLKYYPCVTDVRNNPNCRKALLLIIDNIGLRSNVNIIFPVLMNNPHLCYLFTHNKCINVLPRPLPGSIVGDLFRLPANFFPLLYSDLALLIFPTLLNETERPN